MKKALAILMIFALVASVAFAEISVGAWGRGMFAFVSDSEDTYTTNSTSWGGDWGAAPRIGFTLAGNSDNVGVQADFNVDGGSMNLGDNQYIWVKPMDMLKISLGNMYDDTLRGNAAFGSFDWLRPEVGAGEGEDTTFSRLGMNRGGQNFEVAIQPMDAFYAAVYLANVGSGFNSQNLAENLTKNMQIAAGYTIEGAGQIRAQFLQKGDNSEDTGVVEVAFKLTMIENLYADFGFAMPLDTDVSGDYKKIAAYANYAVDAAKIHFLAIYNLLEDDDSFNIAAGVDYDMGDGIGINADVRYYNDIWNATEDDPDADARITFMAGVSKGFSNGKIGAGVQVASMGDTYWAIPVKMEYWF
jgi:hypothetical protein